MADPVVSDVKYSIYVAPGDGTKTSWEFDFAGGYISKDHVKAFRTNDVTGEVIAIAFAAGDWVGPNTVTISPAVPVGWTLTIYRDTPKNEPLVNYTNGAIINEANLDKTAQQSVFVAAEMVDQFLTVKDISDTAQATSVLALSTANTALSTSNTALSNSATALATANAAAIIANNTAADTALALSTAQGVDAKASTALTQSTNALSVANGVDAKAQTALDNSAAAVSAAAAATATANSANSTATGIAATANSALSQSATALSTANTAKATADQAHTDIGTLTTNLGTTNSNLSAEVTARTSADTSIRTDFAAADAAEATLRSNAIALCVPRTSTTGAANIPVGTTAQRPATASGLFRYNSDLLSFEGNDGTNWGSVGGGAKGGVGNSVFYENDIHVTANYTITSGKNAHSAGPIIIDSGKVVTVTAGSTWVIS